MPEIACMKGTSFHMNNMWIKQLCNHKVWDFAAALRVRKLFTTAKGLKFCKHKAFINNSLMLELWQIKKDHQASRYMIYWSMAGL